MDYGLFLAKTSTIVLAIVVVAIVIIVLASRSREEHQAHIEVKKINEKFEQTEQTLNSLLLSEKEQKAQAKALKAKKKAEEKSETKSLPRVFVLEFDGDIRASAVASLREEITAILLVANEQDEIMLNLTSPGGLVHAYGLASSQLARVRSRNIPLTVAVDKVAASGGYMMACVANKIIAAPFAVIGSIGVIAQIPNFNRLLKKHDIDYEQITAGDYKRTLTMFGENTDKAREKFREEIQDTHELFKEFITANRPSIDISKVATGEHWFATRAKELNLVDELQTSDDYLMLRAKDADVYKITYVAKKRLGSRFAELLSNISDKVQSHLWQRSREAELP